MQDRDRMSDEIPVADAVEQEQETAPEPLDPVDLPVEAPMEAATPDWHEQWQDVVGDDEDGRDEYRE
ncbi:MAG: hypothetical protein J2P16_01380 [Mycobacterium sp.]|nr:hypothetical protein [Mycobacterium sp.]